MPWCPKCKTEYREGFHICSDCGQALVEQCPDGRDRKEGAEEGGDWEFLVYLFNETEADIVIALLETAEISVVKTYKRMGILQKVYTGKASGVDLYVPKSKVEQARELLKAEIEDK